METKSQPTEKVKRLTDKQLVPENCPFLQVPRVNNEIFLCSQSTS